MEYGAAGLSTNALQRVVFIVQFSREFSGIEFEQFDVASKPWRKDFPRRSVTNAVLLQPATNQVAFDENRVVGLSYEALMRDGSVEFGLRFDESRILFVVGNYTRWDAVWPQVSSHLELALKLVPNDNPVVSFATEYTDLFRAAGDYSDFDASCILRLDSQYVPSHIFGRTENFHFHTGFFETLDEPERHRVLTRTNADLRDGVEKDVRDLSIVLFHQISAYREPWGEDVELGEKIARRGLDNFAALHEIDKAALRTILNDDMSTRIGL